MRCTRRTESYMALCCATKMASRRSISDLKLSSSDCSSRLLCVQYAVQTDICLAEFLQTLIRLPTQNQLGQDTERGLQLFAEHIRLCQQRWIADILLL